jgi:hypothetical protein
MALTKNRDWDTNADGDVPIRSRRFDKMTPVVLDGDDGTYFGWEDADGTLYCGGRLTFDAGAQAARDTKATEMSNQAAEETARLNTRVMLKAKREGGGDMTQADMNALADLFLGVDLT